MNVCWLTNSIYPKLQIRVAYIRLLSGRVKCEVENEAITFNGRCCCCLPIPLTLASGEYDLHACGPPARFSIHLASSAVNPAGYVHKSRG